MKATINLIVAYDKNYYIGKDNKLLWNIPDDLKKFKETTTGKIVVMGRKTYESIGRVLPNRINVVLSDNEEFIGTLPVKNIFLENNLKVYNSFDTLIEKLKELSEDEEVFIIGGRSIYKQFIDKDLIDYLYISEIKKSYEGDVKFPFVDFKKYSLIHKKDYKEFIFKKYKKRLDNI